MALYYYQAYTKDGSKVSGYLDAPTEQNVKDQLGRKGLFPISIAIGQPEVQMPWWKKIFSRAPSTKEKILFTQQLSILLKAGVPLLQSLELLVEQFKGRLHTILVTVKDDVKEGISFADALQKYPRTFETIYVQLVRAGEASGNLETVLDRLSVYLEKKEATAKKIKSALAYPLFILSFSVLVVIYLMTQVVPKIAQNFAGMGAALPWPTQFLLSTSEFFQSYYLVILTIFGLLIAAYLWWKSTPQGKKHIDTLKLRIPLVQNFYRTNAVVQFCYTLGVLLQGGVNLSEALDITVKIIDNQIIADELNKARDKIIKHGKIAQYLKQTGIFPPIAIYLIQTGEETGKLDEMLLTVAKNYDVELQERADTLSGVLSPVILMITGLIVGFIVISIALPMVQQAEAV